jgi:hypothetical protein
VLIHIAEDFNAGDRTGGKDDNQLPDHSSVVTEKHAPNLKIETKFRD